MQKEDFKILRGLLGLIVGVFSSVLHFFRRLATLAQMVACLPLFQQVRGSITCGVVNFHLKTFDLGARRGRDVHFLIYIQGEREISAILLTSRRGRLKGPKNMYTIWGLNLILFSENGVSCSVLFTYCLCH